MPQSNIAKWKTFVGGATLFANAGVGQNLNDDLQRAIGDELDAILNAVLGQGVLSGFVVTADTGLSVQVSAGAGFVAGQYLRQLLSVPLTELPAETVALKVYTQASAPFNTVNKSWPALCGVTSGVLTSDQLLLGLVTTDVVGVVSVTDARTLLGQLVNSGGLPDFFLLRSPNGTRWRFTIDNDGILNREALA